ncbi:hypothetical protein [Nostoc sp. NMS9]|uniref:hypothetical protein n=1 Tax=Nostoc sp. NMS9 TaxID=2815393 RepID=UPI0025DE144F|nr:hypothetical protein [Nostoc sp. NMS9]MBN3940878.1 hypothetical protein [Nostoc sp. NMS9]
MKPIFHKSKQEKSSDITQASSNSEIENSKTIDEQVNNTGNDEERISVTVKSSKLPFSFSQSALLGIVAVAIIATFFLVTRGNDFCFFSICSEFPYQNPIVYSFWSAAGGLAGFGVLTLMGVSAPIAIIGGLATWFLMQISLH